LRSAEWAFTPATGPDSSTCRIQSTSIAIGVYVADRANSRIQVFDENGKYLDQWPTGLFQALFGACTSFRSIRMAIFMWLKIMADGTRNTTRNRAPTPTS